ncbi:MAG: hypothetical protein QW735_03545 [archaeon]
MNNSIDPVQCQKQVNRIRRLQNKANVSSFYDNLDESTTDAYKNLRSSFDVNEYFKILRHLSVEKGWKIDYYYLYTFYSGRPVIFAYDENINIRVEELSNFQFGKIPEDIKIDEHYLDHISLDGTKESFFEYVILAITGEQFALWWHSNYEDLEVLCTHEAVEKILNKTRRDYKNLDEKTITLALRINPTPSVIIKDEYAIVKIVVFTKWGGFYKLEFHISKQLPHKELKFNKKLLVGFHCRIWF